MDKSPISRTADRKDAASLPKSVILMVEDFESVRQMNAVILRRAGYEVMEAANATEAIDLFEAAGQRVDLVVTDVHLGGAIDGPQLAGLLRRRRDKLPVILTTGGDVSRLRTMTSGPTKFLAKPYAGSTLSKTIAEMLGVAAGNGPAVAA